jgi:hypothetical protein
MKNNHVPRKIVGTNTNNDKSNNIIMDVTKVRRVAIPVEVTLGVASLLVVGYPN